MKILHVEDSAADAELAAASICSQWPDCEITVVSRRSDFISEVQAGGHDLIISDYSMVAFNGLEALSVARQNSPDTPFIFFSGTIGEERAVAALQAGASDYVIKDRSKRLIPAIQRVLTASEERKARRRLEEQILRNQRTENIGLLASGIAHDLNNVLTPILMAAPMLREKTKDPNDAKLLTLLEKSAERGAGLVRQILAFAQGASGERRVTPVKTVTNEIVAFISETFPKSIRFTHQIPADLKPIRANPTHIHQVLLNLCINARDAMADGGALSLTAENAVLDEAAVAEHADARPGDFVMLEVRDTGSGIPEHVLERMWEPFFTTKPAGKGTGLGLSTVRGIVENHEGFVTVKTAAGEGTTFRVYLPAVQAAAAADGAKPSKPWSRGHGETVLVVDDEKDVRHLAAAILSTYGYRVISAGDGAEALALFSQRNKEVCLVISDMQMPNFDGAVLSRVLRRMAPAIKILAMSGMSPGGRAAQGQAPVTFGDSFLKKPFTPEMLLDQVQSLVHPAA